MLIFNAMELKLFVEGAKDLLMVKFLRPYSHEVKYS